MSEANADLARLAGECEWALAHADDKSWTEVLLPFFKRAADAAVSLDRDARACPGASPVTPERLAEIRRLESAASPGPWVSFAANDSPFAGQVRSAFMDDQGGAPFTHIADTPEHDERDADMAFIADARSAVPELLALIDHQRREIDEEAAWLARLMNDKECDRGLMQVGVAKALDAIRSYARLHLDQRAHEALTGVYDVVKDCCGDAPLPPHLRTLARLRRLEGKMREAEQIIGTAEHSLDKLTRLARLVSEALSPTEPP